MSVGALKLLWIGWRRATACVLFGVAAAAVGGAWLIEGFHARSSWRHLDKTTEYRASGILGGMPQVQVRAVLGWPIQVPREWIEPDILIPGQGFGYYRANAGRERNGAAIRETGWPVRAVRTESASEGNSSVDRGWGVGGVRVRGAHLGVRPTWGGFIVGLVVWVASPWLLMSGLAGARVRSRSRRGLCVVCRYDVHALDVCPECGVPCNDERAGESALSNRLRNG